MAEGKDPQRTTLQEVCSEAITELTPEDTVDNAVKLMARKHIRRIPVMEGTRPVRQGRHRASSYEDPSQPGTNGQQ